MTQERAIALTEVWLDERARMAGPSIPIVRVRKEWSSVIGQVLAVVGLGMLAVEYWRMW